MTIATTRAALRAALAMATPASSSKSSMPILDGVLFAGAESGVTLTCTDAFVSAVASLACEHGGEAFVAKADTLRKVVDSMPDGPIELRLTDTQLVVKAGSNTARLPYRPADEFPRVPSPPAQSELVRAGTLSRLLLAVRHSAATGSASKDGIVLRLSPGKVECTAAGGHSVARAWDSCGAATSLEAHLPPAGVTAILKALSLLDDDEDVPVAVADSRVFVAHVSAMLYDQQAQNVEKLLDVRVQAEIIVPREALIAAVKRASITADDGAKISLSCCALTGELAVASESSAGDSVAVLQGSVPKREPIFVSADYLLAQLEQVPDDDVTIGLMGNDQLAPLRFASSNYVGITAVIHPTIPAAKNGRAKEARPAKAAVQQ